MTLSGINNTTRINAKVRLLLVSIQSVHASRIERTSASGGREAILIYNMLYKNALVVDQVRSQMQEWQQH